jgi:uncharacterized damage-inducible protein DinB
MSETLDTGLLRFFTVKLLTEFPHQLTTCVDSLDEEDLWWRPHDQANAVGNPVLHAAGSNRHYLEHVIGGAPGVRDRASEFAARGAPAKADLLRVWADATARCAQVLGGLAPADLGRPTPDRGRSVADVLLHVTHHNALHIGQIVWITKLRRPGALHELMRAPQGPPRDARS